MRRGSLSLQAGRTERAARKIPVYFDDLLVKCYLLGPNPLLSRLAAMRIRNQLLILVLTVLLPGFLASVLAVWYVYSEEQEAQEKGMSEAARAFSLLIANELQAKEGILRTLAESTALARGDLEEFYFYAKKMAPTTETTIILVDKSDRQLLNTRAPFDAELPKRRAANINELMERYGATTSIVSDVFLAPVGKRHDFILQVPVMHGNEIRYFLVMGINAAALQPLLHKQKLPEGWLGVIVDRKGVVVSRSRDPERFVGQPSDESLTQIFSSRPAGVLRTVTLDGIRVKTFFNRVAFSDWTAILSIPESELRRTPMRAAALLALMLGILLAVALIAARQVSAKIVSRMEQLGESADKLAQGMEVHYRPRGLVEIDAVGSRIVDASKQIHRNKQELEDRVAEAIAETERVQRFLLQSQKLEALGRLTGGIAHEFNNLLQTLTTALQLARMVSNQERVQSLIETCNKAVERATSLTSQLGAFGRIQDATLATVSLDARVGNFEQLVENILPATIGLEVSISPDLWPVTIDPAQFELALINLAINAKDAMRNGGKIRVSLCNAELASPPTGLAPGDYVRVSVADTGVGMKPEVMAKALDPFFTTKKVGQGSGLGLPQAYGFALQSGGTLLLNSSEGEGTTVDIYLPRAREQVGQPARSLEGAGPTSSSAGTLLFVEDDPLVREAVIPALETAGFSVHTAESADQAMAMLDAGVAVTAVFSDVVMPGSISGVELANVIRRRFPQVGVVLATGYSDERVAIPGVRVLRKPYATSEAISALAEVSDN